MTSAEPKGNAWAGDDPAVTDPGFYTVVFENDRVRVLEYRDEPGDKTRSHRHPDSVMVTLSSFRRRISHGGDEVEVDLPAGVVRWVGAQEHAGHNVGETPTHSIFVELKDVPDRGRRPGRADEGLRSDPVVLGPQPD